MPIYEYRRPDGSTFEVLARLSDAALTHDPESGEPVRRVYTAPAVHFHGSGFYDTDVGSVRGNRELERAAEAGADAHDDKFRQKRRDAERSKADAARRRRESHEAARIRGDAPKRAPRP